MTDRADLEGPPDPEPCSCDEAMGLKAQIDEMGTEYARSHTAHMNALGQVEGLRSELLGARADAAKQFEERMALVTLLGRIVKYAREDRATTPGTTRLARALAEAEKLLSAPASPPAPPPARVTLLEEIAEGVVDMLDGEPSGSDSLDWALEQYGYKPTKGVDPDAPPIATEPEAGEVYFCIECGGANVTRCDEDGCCVSCGVPLVTLVEIRTALAAGDLSVVDAKDRAVLEAMSHVPDEMLRNSIEYRHAHEASKPVAKAELARREKP